MNERILELAEQATKKISFRLDPNTYKHIDDPEGDLERFEFDKQKFAQLIVRECSGFVYNYPEKYLTRNQSAEICMSMEEHFGITE